MRVFFYSSLFVLFFSACSDGHDPKILFDQGNYEKSLPLWTVLANQNDALAQNYVGIQYYLGLGTKRNFREAKQWFEKSAKQGFADAQYNLGTMYENGEFVEQDYITAYMWFYLAKENGNTHSTKRMKALAEEHKLFPNQIKRAAELSKQYTNKQQ